MEVGGRCRATAGPLGGKNKGELQTRRGVSIRRGLWLRLRAGPGQFSPRPSGPQTRAKAEMARPRVRLVVTADDFGYCPRRDEGIVEAFLAGAVTSVSLLVNGATAESAAELARR